MSKVATRGREHLAEVSTDVAEPWLDELLTPPVVAALLHVSAPTVYAAIQKPGVSLGHIRTPGGQIRIRRRDLLAYCHRAGVPVPAGLVKPDPAVVLLHSVKAVGNRVCRILEPICRVEVFSDDIEGLINIGALSPPLVIVGESYGERLLGRLCSAIEEVPEVGYTTVIVLGAHDRGGWDGGPVPLPLPWREPASLDDAGLRHVVSKLLGLR
jgi:excisionase family DNA binding protein